MKKFIALLFVQLYVVSFILCQTACAQFGVIDSTFGVNGIVKTPISATGSSVCNNLISLPNGKIIATGYVVSGNRDLFAIVRYNSNGTIDNTFANNGIDTVSINDTVLSICYSSALQKDGKIILGGDYYLGAGLGYGFMAIRYNSDGSLDASFGNKGAASFHVGTAGADNVGHSVSLQTDGKIIMAGTATVGGNTVFCVLRFTKDGTIDPTFGTNGVTTTVIGTGSNNCYSMAVQDDDRIVLGGDFQDGSAYKFTAVRYNKDGLLDNTFANNGIFMDSIGVNDDDYGYATVIQKDQKIIFGGTAKKANTTNFAMLRLNASGVLDNTFGTGGVVVANFDPTSGTAADLGRRFALQSDGKIIIGGETYLHGSEYGLMRYNSDGSLDNTFGNAGRVVYKAGSTQQHGYALTIDSNRKIILGGDAPVSLPSNFVLVSFTSGLSAGPNEVEAQNSNPFSLYPDPANEIVSVSWPDAEDKKVDLKMVDIKGVEVLKTTAYGPEFKVDIRNLPSGVYIMTMTAGGVSKSGNICIQK